jgi:hypothetical protein
MLHHLCHWIVAHYRHMSLSLSFSQKSLKEDITQKHGSENRNHGTFLEFCLPQILRVVADLRSREVS